jgi:cell division protein FtsI/penicillin-binding protein 2
LFKVVNSPHGTAYKYARFIDDGYALCGKTGTATAMPRPTSFQVPYVGESSIESSVIVAAGSRGEAIDEFERLHPEATFDPRRIRKHEEWPRLPPPGGGRHAHAWFAGYLQRLDSAGLPMYEVQPRIAFAVLVEYGGSGGRTSGPIARQVAGIIVDALGDDLDPDAGAPMPGAWP